MLLRTLATVIWAFRVVEEDTFDKLVAVKLEEIFTIKGIPL